MAAKAQIMVSAETRDSLLRLKLRIAADIGRNITMNEIIPMLIRLAENHQPELTQIAQITENT